jgi:hypothetical protein
MNQKEKLRQLWKERVADYKNSDLTMKKWCEVNELKIHQLQYWLKKYKTSGQETQQWVTIDMSNEQGIQSNGSLLLEVGPCKLVINPDFDPSTLKAVVEVLIGL